MNKINEKMSLYKVADKKMGKTKGGINCGCACQYVNCGGSSIDDNYDANNMRGLWPKGTGCK